MTPTLASSALPSAPRYRPKTLADLIEQLGDIPPERIWLHPYPGTATEQDVLDADAHQDRLCELVDGVLVEKPMGVPESIVATTLIRILGTFAHDRKLGVVTGPDGMLRLLPNLVRMPDVGFFSRARLAGRKLAAEQVLPLAPDLAIEVLSPSNTPREMQRKLREYFDAGAQLVWIVDPAPNRRLVAVHLAPSQFTALTQEQVLDGGSVLPGFSVPVRDLFADLEEEWTA